MTNKERLRFIYYLNTFTSMNSSTFRVAVKLIEGMLPSDVVRMRRETVSKHLGLNARTVSRAFKELCELGVIERVQTGRSHMFCVTEETLLAVRSHKKPRIDPEEYMPFRN